MELKRKGQFTIEFVIAVVSFIFLVVYVMNFVNKETPAFTSRHNTDVIRARAYQISEFLIFDDGNWDANPATPSRIGISSGYHMVNATKIKYLNDLCSAEAGYKNILSDLNINTHAVINQYTGSRSYLIQENSRCMDLNIYNNTHHMLSCPPSGSQNWECINNFVQGTTQKYQIVRYAPDTNGNVINVTVGVW